MNRKRALFFIGWAPVPRGLRGFLAAAAVGLVALFSGVAYLAAATQDDPGDGAFRFDWGRQTVTGVLTAEPYPLVHLTEATERFPAGRTLLLSGVGKRGVQDRAGPLDGASVTVSGVALKRGTVDMLQVRPQADGLVPTEAAAGATAPAPPAPVALGRWRVTGEICDGKCYAGAMRPGDGLAHRACASLCLIGGVPPIFVTTDPVDGESFLLLADAEGRPVTDAVLDHVATLVDVEGTVERVGTILVFRIEPETLRLAR